MQLEIGDIVKTSYQTGPYRIVDILRDCTCPEYVRSLDGDETPSAPHLHLICTDLGGKGQFYLGGFDEKTLQSVWNGDYLEVCKNDRPVQMSLF